MLSITLHNEPDLVSFKLKGHLREGELDELRSYYRLLSTFPHEKCVVVDLSGIRTVDEAGKELLREMSRAGTEFLLNERSHSFSEILDVLVPTAAAQEQATTHVRWPAPAPVIQEHPFPDRPVAEFTDCSPLCRSDCEPISGPPLPGPCDPI